MMIALCGALVPVAQAIEVTVGQSMTLTLPENPSTGFMWSVAECPDVVQVGLAFEPRAPESGTPLCGSHSTTVVVLTGLKVGQGVVKLVYARPWEKDKAPADTRVYTVTVK